MSPHGRPPYTLLEAQSLLAAIVDSSEDAIISKDLKGVVQSWNKAAERIFGFKADEMIGRSITHLFPPERLGEEPPILERIQRGERVEHFETVRIRKDGVPIAVSVTISPIRDVNGKVVGASKIARDITKSIELEGRFKAFVESSDDAIISKNLDGIVQIWNPSAERMFGYTADEMIGNSIIILFPIDRIDEEPKILDQLRRGQRVDHFETVRVCKDGRLIDVSVTISPIKDPTGRVVGVSKVARDITSIKRIMREREELLVLEKNAREEAERIGRMKDDFLSTLSHELRTPLNAILGWATVLRSNPNSKPEDLKRGHEAIERNARAQAELIEELLDMSRIINGKLRLEVQPLNLQVVVTEAMESIRPAAAAKGIYLEIDLGADSAEINGDPNRIQQVLWNLLSNAVKFTPAGGKVKVALNRTSSHASISIEDTGQGISPDFLPHLFTRFSQAETSMSRRYGGLGLGLALVKSLVELHGGTVQALSAGTNQGSSFYINLPIAATINQPALDASKTNITTAPKFAVPDLSGLRVLVVDDEKDARELIQHILQGAGAIVTLAASSKEALEFVKRYRPDVILSDVAMPQEDGYHFLTKLRHLTDSEGGNTPAVALTAFARSEDRRRALIAGFQMHVPKPVEPAELLAVVSNLYETIQRAKTAA